MNVKSNPTKKEKKLIDSIKFIILIYIKYISNYYENIDQNLFIYYRRKI